MYIETLLVLSLQIFSKIHPVFSNAYGQGFDVIGFKRDWCRQRKAALNWSAILEPCRRDLEYSIKPRSINLT